MIHIQQHKSFIRYKLNEPAYMLKKRSVLFLEYNYLFIPEKVIKKGFVEQEEWRARCKGKYIPFASVCVGG